MKAAAGRKLQLKSGYAMRSAGPAYVRWSPELQKSRPHPRSESDSPSGIRGGKDQYIKSEPLDLGSDIVMWSRRQGL